MKVGQRFLVIRYGVNIVGNCIDEHKKILDEKGYCWFGKIGVVPSKKVIDEVMNSEQPTIILYSRDHAYECGLESVMHDKPKEG